MQSTCLSSVSNISTACRISRNTTTQQPVARRQVAVVARAQPPKGVSMPPVSPARPPPLFGFVDNAEKWNSRAAMIGFFSLLAVEAITGKGLLELLGYTTGNGLGFEF